MRLPRFLLAGVLLFAGVFLLTALFAQSPYRWVGVTATAVFLPLWYAISALNAWLGVVSAGHRIGEELAVSALVFGIPSAVAGGAWWASVTQWEGGPTIHTGRTPVVLAAGAMLWAAAVLVAELLTPQPSAALSTATAAAVFVPLWLLLCLANLAIGVATAGYTISEEAPIFLLNAAVPVAIAIGAWKWVRDGAWPASRS